MVSGVRRDLQRRFLVPLLAVCNGQCLVPVVELCDALCEARAVQLPLKSALYRPCGLQWARTPAFMLHNLYRMHSLQLTKLSVGLCGCFHGSFLWTVLGCWKG
jgi:hypothetical protein